MNDWAAVRERQPRVVEMPSNLEWRRRSSSPNNFDLVLTAPDQLDAARLLSLLDSIEAETHRGLSLSGRASRELRRWAANPDTPLKSEAYVLLSNWFTTNSGDRRSMVASRCEDLWAFLFLCRPARRLSSPEPNKNHTIVPAEFWSWWNNMLGAEGGAAQAQRPEQGSP